MARRASVGGLLLLLSTTACGTERGDPHVVRRDSAGIEIVENVVDDASIPVWQLGLPIVSIGTVDGEEPTQLHEVMGAVMLGDAIAILDGGSSEVRIFDRGGRHLRTIGRHGEGPGEFRSGYWLGTQPGDSIAVYDFSLRRLTVFDRDGRPGRIVGLGHRGGHIAGRLADGSFVIRPAIFVGRREDVRPGIVRDSLPILLVSDDDGRFDTLAFYPGQELERSLTGPAGGERVTLRIRPFGLSSDVATDDTLIYAGSKDRWEIDVLDRRGRLLRSIRRRLERRLVTEQVIARYREARLAPISDDDERRAVERSISSAPFPARLPAHGRLRVDDLGQLWVEDYRIVPGDSLRWTIFDPSGRIVGRITLPPNFTIHQSGADFVLALTRDELDVQRVVLYPLERPAIR